MNLVKKLEETISLASKVLGQALLAENQASAEGMRYLQALDDVQMFRRPFLEA